MLINIREKTNIYSEIYYRYFMPSGLFYIHPFHQIEPEVRKNHLSLRHK